MGTLIFLALLGPPALASPELDEATKQAAEKYGVELQILRAIANLESSYGKRAVLKRNKNATYDLGAMQINSVHWHTTCKDLDVSVLQGNVDCGARILKQAQKWADSDPNWVGRFHSRTPSLKRGYARKVYRILNRALSGAP